MNEIPSMSDVLWTPKSSDRRTRQDHRERDDRRHAGIRSSVLHSLENAPQKPVALDHEAARRLRDYCQHEEE